MGDVTRFPWEQLPVASERTVEDTVKLLQKDFAYAIQFTAILVHSNRPEFHKLVNTRRGQIVPRGECRFTDGTKFELQDVGMPQPGAPEMTVRDLITELSSIATALELEYVL